MASPAPSSHRGRAPVPVCGLIHLGPRRRPSWAQQEAALQKTLGVGRGGGSSGQGCFPDTETKAEGVSAPGSVEECDPCLREETWAQTEPCAPPGGFFSVAPGRCSIHLRQVSKCHPTGSFIVVL